MLLKELKNKQKNSVGKIFVNKVKCNEKYKSYKNKSDSTHLLIELTVLVYE